MIITSKDGCSNVIWQLSEDERTIQEVRGDPHRHDSFNISNCCHFSKMRNWRVATFFSFVTIILSSRRLSSRGTVALKAVSALSTKGIVRPEKHYACNILHSNGYGHPHVAATAVITSFATKSRMSTCSLNMATSSSDLKNDITHTKILTTKVDEGVMKKKKQVDKDLEETSKKQAKRFKGISNNVVSRLAKAAKEAAVAKKRKTTTAAAKEKKKARRSAGPSYNDYTRDTLCFDDDCPIFEDDEDSDVNQDDLSSIMKLNNVIDEELLRPTDGYKPSRETDSIRVLLEHNNNQNCNSGRPTLNKSIISSSSSALHKNKKNGKSNDNNMTDKDVAIVFARPLSEDQLTIEYAVRLVSLAKAMKFEGYKPNLICFMGPASSSTFTTVDTTTAKHDSVTSIGVEFFRQLCLANEISLEETDLCRIPDLSSTTTTRTKSQQYDDDSHDGSYHGTFSNQHPSSFASSWSPSSLNPIVKKMLNKKYLEKWLEESKAYESDMDEYGMTRQEPRKKIHIHWKLFSTEYHLCNLNDIHIRSPRQSPLARLMHDLEHAASSEHYRRGIIRTTWSFHYSIYPYVVSSNKEKMKEAFLGKCYLMAQSLVPLLVNLRGVAENVSSFKSILGDHRILKPIYKTNALILSCPQSNVSLLFCLSIANANRLGRSRNSFSETITAHWWLLVVLWPHF